MYCLALDYMTVPRIDIAIDYHGASQNISKAIGDHQTIVSDKVDSLPPSNHPSDPIEEPD